MRSWSQKKRIYLRRYRSDVPGNGGLFSAGGDFPAGYRKIRLAAQNADVSICYEDGIQQVYLNGSNVTDRLREEAVGNMASVSSAVREVRARLLDLQRNLAKEADVIMDGRDIGTNILPNADVKIYLTASVKQGQTDGTKN